MQPSKQDIENAARLVPGTDNAWSRARGVPMCLGRQVEEGGAYVIREWQPWADTEAGRSDALVLLAAVKKYFLALTQGADPTLIELFCSLCDAEASGDVQQIQQATFAAAAAIGANFPEGNAIKGAEGE